MKTCSETFLSESGLAWESAGEGVCRQIMAYDGQMMMVKVKFEKGAVGTPHEHYHSQGCYVAGGRFRVSVGDRMQVLGPGDGFYVAPGTEHGVVCLEEGMLLDVFSPMRADFLKK